MREYSRGFKNGDASTSVIICSRSFMIEMAAIDDLSGHWIGTRNRSGHDRPVARSDSGFHMGIENNVLAIAQTRPQCLRSLARNHKGEARRLPRFQMSPPHNSCIQA